MAPQGKVKYSSALQLASNGAAWHEFIHEQPPSFGPTVALVACKQKNHVHLFQYTNLLLIGDNEGKGEVTKI